MFLDCLNKVMIEITVRNPNNIKYDIPECLTPFLDGEKNGKRIYLVHPNFIGFQSGEMLRLKNSGMDVYIAVSYITEGNEKVTNVRGEEVRPFIHTHKGKESRRFVKTVMIVDDGRSKAKLSLKINRPYPL